MTKRINNFGVIGLMLFAAGSMCLAQGTGEATYKAKCAMCHGATGAADTAGGKATKALPFTKASDADMIATIKNGKGKMPAYGSKLTDPQIKEVAAYVHTLIK